MKKLLRSTFCFLLFTFILFVLINFQQEIPQQNIGVKKLNQTIAAEFVNNPEVANIIVISTYEIVIAKNLFL